MTKAANRRRAWESMCAITTLDIAKVEVLLDAPPDVLMQFKRDQLEAELEVLRVTQIFLTDQINGMGDTE